MLKDFELAAKRHEEIKEAGVAALAAKPLVAAGKWALKNPLKTLVGALTVSDVATGAKNLASSVRKTPVTGPGTFIAGPRTF